jgi:hypothetical protein
MKSFFSAIVFSSVLSVMGTASAFSAMCNPPSAALLQRSQAFLQNTPCAPLVTACNQAGYVLNCHKADGKGLEVDCIQPLFKGTVVTGMSMQPTDPNVASCKTYCHSNKGACAEQKGVSDR